MGMFEDQLSFNKKQAEEMRNNKQLVYILTRAVKVKGIENLAETNSDLLNDVIDVAISSCGLGRPTPTMRAGAVLILADILKTEKVVLKSGFVLRKDSKNYITDRKFHEKKSTKTAHASVPNFTYVEIGGVPVGIREELDFVDVVEV